MLKNKEYKVSVQLSYDKHSEENELLSFHIYKPDEESARMEAFEKAKVWTSPGVHTSYEVRSIREVIR